VYTADGFLKSDAGKNHELKGVPIDDPLIGAMSAVPCGTYKTINNKFFKLDVHGS